MKIRLVGARHAIPQRLPKPNDHTVSNDRADREYETIAAYIANNPSNWINGNERYV